jgi:hypothetical protein
MKISLAGKMILPTSDITREILTQKLRNSLKNKEAQKGKTQNPNVVPS